MKCGTTSSTGGMDRLKTEMFCLTKKSVELVPIMTNLFNGTLRQGLRYCARTLAVVREGCHNNSIT